MYSFFVFAFKVCKKCYYDPKNFFLEKYQYGYKKTQNFMLIPNFEYFRFCAFFRGFLLLTFVRGISFHFSNGFEISIKFCVFLIPILKFFNKKFVWVIIALFANILQKVKSNFFGNIYQSPFDSYWNSKKSIKLKPPSVQLHCTTITSDIFEYNSKHILSESAISIYNYSPRHHCCGSMTFWCGSGPGSADSCLWLMDPDTDSIFVIVLQDAINKLNFFKKVFCLLLFECTFTSFFKDKKSKRGHKAVRIKVFLTIFAWWYEVRPKSNWKMWIKREWLQLGG